MGGWNVYDSHLRVSGVFFFFSFSRSICTGAAKWWATTERWLFRRVNAEYLNNLPLIYYDPIETAAPPGNHAPMLKKAGVNSAN